MTKKREKAPVLEPKSIDHAENIMADYAKTDAEMAEITAIMDQEITVIRNKFADKLQELAEKKEEKFLQLQLFAEQNKQLFEKRKSVEMAHGLLGFRTGTPKLKAKKGFTWASVTSLLKEFLPAYVRTTEEPAKDKLLADREIPANQLLYKKVGIEIVQDESFFIELKKENFAAAK